MTDNQLRDSVIAALKWEPSIDSTQIGVTVNQGVVVLLGEVRTFAEKTAAGRVVLRIHGAKAVANDLAVHFSGSLDRSDTDVALAVINALKWSSMVPPDKVTPSVSNGWVTLNGQLDWHYQRLAAASAVRDLAGVRGVTNDIKIRPCVSVADAESEIEAERAAWAAPGVRDVDDRLSIIP